MRLNGIGQALRKYDQRVKQTRGMVIIAAENTAEQAHVACPGAKIVVPSRVDPGHVGEVDWQDTFSKNAPTPGLLDKASEGLLREAFEPKVIL